MQADRYFLQQWGERKAQRGLTYGLSPRNHGPHAVDFIQWASLLQGNSEAALRVAKNTADGVSRADLDRGRNLRAVASYWMTLRAFGRWREILALPQPPASQPYLQGIYRFARGAAFLGQNDLPRAQAELSALTQLLENPQLKSQRAAVNSAFDLLAIAQSQLEGELASAKGEHRTGISSLQRTVALQDELLYMEPPDWMHSTRLYLGQVLLAAGEPAKAEAVFREDLELLRENGWALRGLQQSLEAQGKRDRSVETRAKQAWTSADIRPERVIFD